MNKRNRRRLKLTINYCSFFASVIIYSVMGQIIIELPSRIKRRYRLDNEELTNAILARLDRDAEPIKDNPVKLTAEDKADIRAANRARKGDLVSWESVKERLGLP